MSLSSSSIFLAGDRWLVIWTQIVCGMLQLGQFKDLQKTLQRLGFTGSINTALAKRLNLTLRHGLAALPRRSWATAQLIPELEAHLQWWRAWYHFCRPHQGRRQKLDTPQACMAQQTAQLYHARPPHSHHAGLFGTMPVQVWPPA
jgi:hypothetical protein